MASTTTMVPSALSRVEVDEVWKALGRYGRYQLSQVLLLVLGHVHIAMPVLSGVFEGGENPHTCRPPASFMENASWTSNDSITSEQCRVIVYTNDTEDDPIVTSSCDGYEFELPVDRSFVSEWGLVCDRAALVQLSQTLLMSGILAGSFFLAGLADQYGRKPLLLASQLGQLVVGVAMAFVPSYIGLGVCKFFQGVCTACSMVSFSILYLELLPKEQRAMMGTLSALLWAVSIMTISLVAFLTRLRSWRTMQLVFAAFNLPCLLHIFFVDESLRWLVANNRYKDIMRVIRKAARINGLDPETVFSKALARSDALHGTVMTEQKAGDVGSMLLQDTEVNAAEDKGRHVDGTDGNGANGDTNLNGVGVKEPPENEELWKEGMEVEGKRRHDSPLDIVRNSHMRMLTLLMVYTWMVNSMTYYGVTLLSSSLAGDRYINFFLGGLLEIPANFILWWAMEKIGRKKTLIAFKALASVTLLAASVVAAYREYIAGIVQTVLTLVARFGIAASFNGVWIYTPELYPTNLRNRGLGTASAGARVGGMASPFFGLLGDVAIWAPGAIFCATCSLAMFFMTLLPETRKRVLPRTISDYVVWRQEDRLQRSARKDDLTADDKGTDGL